MVRYRWPLRRLTSSMPMMCSGSHRRWCRPQSTAPLTTAAMVFQLKRDDAPGLTLFHRTAGAEALEVGPGPAELVGDDPEQEADLVRPEAVAGKPGPVGGFFALLDPLLG